MSGPLTLLDAGAGDFASGGEGVVVIDERCVRIELGGGQILHPVWPVDRVRWRPKDEVIQFEQPDGASIEISEGDVVGVGGSAVDPSLLHQDESESPNCPGLPFAVTTVEVSPA